MNPFLLFILLDLPYMPGPVIPEEFPSGYYMPGEDSLHTLRHYSWKGSDTLELRIGEPLHLSDRYVFSAGCPVSETDFTEPPDTKPDRVTDFACSDGKVVGWFSAIRRDSGVYHYRNGLLDSMLRFEKVTSQKPFTRSRTFKIGYDASGRPVKRQDYWFEGTAVPEDSLTTDYAYHLPDSIVMRSFDVAVEEKRTTTIRLAGGKPVSMSEVVEQNGRAWNYGHVWTWSVTSAIRKAGNARRTGRLADRGATHFGKDGVRLDGRRRGF
jgi:hypothetical protein